jgi:hypothetical protein
MKRQADKQLVDEAVEAYLDWREDCAAVWDSFEQWESTTGVAAAAAFSAYRAALDREECTSHASADVLARIATGKGRERLRRELELTSPTSATGDSPGETT